MSSPTGVKGAIIATVVATLIASCAGPSQVGTSTPASALGDQATAIADGVISANEYELGFTRYRLCLEAEGYALVLDGKRNQSYQFGIPAVAVESGVDARCYGDEFREIDILWQLSHQDTSDSTEAMRDCLREVGIEPEWSTAAVERQLLDAGIAPQDCGR